MDLIDAVDLAAHDYTVTLGHACMTEQETVRAIRTTLTKDTIKARFPESSPLRDAYFMILDADKTELINVVTTFAPQGARPPTPALLRILIGAPGIGKTTWCTRCAGELGHVLSLDTARAAMGEGEHDQEVTPIAVDWVREQAEVLLAEGSDVTIDATGACREDRASWIELARQHGAVPVAVVFRFPLQKALDGNRSRERRVPEDVIRTMWHEISQTTDSDLRSEGFAEIHTLDD